MTGVLSAPIISRLNDTNVRDVIDFFCHQKTREFTLTIRTEFVGPTDTTGSCYRAADLLGDSVHFQAARYDLTTVENHLNSAINLIRDFRTGSYILQGYESTETGYLFAFDRLEANK